MNRCTKLLSLITAHLALVTQSHAFSPLSPPGGQRGTSVTITLTDDNIATFKELITYQPGLSLTDLKPDGKNKKKATAILHIAPDAPLGEHPLRIRTENEVSFLQTFHVGHFPTLQEKEPNNTLAEAQPIPLNTTAQGTITTEDQDTYLVSLKKGQRLSVEAEAMRLGRTVFDARITIFSPSGTTIASSDDTPLLKTDPFLSFIAPSDADYTIAIREATYQGNGLSQYRLHVGTFPRPATIFPLGGKPGESIEFTFTGDPAGPFKKTITLPDQPTPRHPVFPVSNGETAPSPHTVTVSALEHISQYGNLGKDTAILFPPIPSAVDGILNQASQKRYFRFQAKKKQDLEIKVLARTHRSPLDSVLILQDKKGKNLQFADDNQNLPDSLIKWKCPADGEYFLIIKDQLNRTGPDFTFRIQIEEKSPSLKAYLPTTERNQPQKDKAFTIPRGNRYATVIQLSKANLSGDDITFTTQNLPPGIKLITPPIPRSINSFPVIFEATPDAPLTTTLHPYTISATTKNPAKTITSPLTDTINLVEVNNEGTYHSVTSDRIPTTVIPAAAFSITADPPTIPIVKNGKLMIKIKANRAPGFDGKITIKLLWTPPGLSAPGSVDIPPGETEALYEINAKKDAEPATWQTCFTAEANTPGSRVKVSTPFIPITISEPYVTLTLDLTTATIGQPATFTTNIDQLIPFEGKATVELLALPYGVSSKTLSFTKKDTTLTFPLKIKPDAKPGKTTNVHCKVLIPEKGQKITHITAHGGTLRLGTPEKK
ncbi:MAG: hypothetical protein ACSHX7_11845 [Luteolibacter sp.]